MRARFWPTLMIIVLPLAAVRAQDPETPNQVRVGPEKISLEELRRLGQTSLLNDIDPKTLKLLAELAQKPEFRKLVEEMRQRRQAGSDSDLPPPIEGGHGFGDVLQDFMRGRLGPRHPGEANRNPDEGADRSSSGIGPSVSGQREGTAGPPGESATGNNAPASEPSTAGSPPESGQDDDSRAFSRWLAGQSRSVQRMAGPLSRSAAFKEALHKWAVAAAAPAARAGSGPGGIEQELAKLMHSVSGSKVWPRIRTPNLHGWHWPGLGRVGAGAERLGAQLRGLPMPSLGAGHAPAVQADDSSWLGAVFALALGLGLAVWLIYRRTGARAGLAGTAGWRLGAWPVDPSRLENAQQLIRDFEHLSLLRLGLESRTWNHRAIATRLAVEGANAPEIDQAATHLATLYERARYAPGRQELDAADVAAARRELTLLAGVATP